MKNWTYQLAKVLGGLAYAGGALFIALSFIVGGSIPSTTHAQPAQIDDQWCGDGWDMKDEVGPPWSLSAPSGYVWYQVGIKAATDCFKTKSNGEVAGCYEVSGLGTDTLTVRDLPDAPSECHAVSHILGKYQQEEPTDTPRPTNTPEDPTETPTDTPEEPTETPTDTPEDPTATPTNTPEPPTETPTDTPEGPTNTPTETPDGPTSTPTDTDVPEDPTATPTATNTPEDPTATPTETEPPNDPTTTPTATPDETQPPTTDTPDPTVTSDPRPSPTNTQPPALNPTPTSTPEEILIPVTGVDLSGFGELNRQGYVYLGVLSFGIGLILHGYARREEST
jgi:hypothetical protein